MCIMKNLAANCSVSACKQTDHSVIAVTTVGAEHRSAQFVEGEAISKRRDQSTIARDDSGNSVGAYCNTLLLQ